MQVAYPLRIDSRGRSAEATDEQHIRDLIEQILFTAPGERVNRPTFGSALRQQVFAPNNESLAAALQASLQGAMQQWLGNIIEVGEISVVTEDMTLRIAIGYRLRATGENRSTLFNRTLP